MTPVAQMKHTSRGSFQTFDKTMITNKQPKRVSPKKDTIRFLLCGLALMLASISAAFLFIPESFQSGRTIQYKQAIVPQYGVILMWTVVLFIVGGICVSNSITTLKRHKTSHRTNQVTLRDDPSKLRHKARGSFRTFGIKI
jgi:hypothetical protein